MRLLYILLCFGVSTASLPDEPTSHTLPNGKIDDVHHIAAGFRLQPRESPWHAGIYQKTTKPYMQICGATVVTTNAVITAAHCFSHDINIPPASGYAVAAGKIYRPWNDPQDTGAQKSDVKEIRVPPRYQGSAANFQDDIAVVIIFTEFFYNVYVSPACLSFNYDFDEAQLKNGQLGKIAGWGLKGDNSPPSQVLQGANLPIVPIDKCIEQSPAGFRSSITGDKICAGYNNGTAVCRGDSGGGLVFQSTVNYQNHVFLRGIVSTAPTSENKCNVHTWATFTHVLKHEHFLMSVLPDIELSCVRNSSQQTFEFRFGGNSQLTSLDKKCACVCPNNNS